MNKRIKKIVVLTILLILLSGCTNEGEEYNSTEVMTDEKNTISNISERILNNQNLDFNNRGLTQFKLECQINGVKDIYVDVYYGYLIDNNSNLYRYVLGGYKEDESNNCILISNVYRYSKFLGNLVVDSSNNIYEFDQDGNVKIMETFDDSSLKYIKENDLSYNKTCFYYQEDETKYVYIDDNKVYSLPDMELINDFNDDSIDTCWGGIIKTSKNYYRMNSSNNYVKAEKFDDNLLVYYSLQPSENAILIVDKYYNLYNNIVVG